MHTHSKPSNRKLRIVASALLAVLLALALVLPAVASGGWAPTGSMTTGRSRHLAVRLNDGRVLVAAGYTDAADDTAEIYDPATGSWSATSSMNFAHYLGTMTKLNDGRALIVGGQNNGTIAETYDPASGTWSITGSLNQGRWSHTATLLVDGRVLVVGGWNGSTLIASAEIYDPSAGTWSTTASLIEDRFDHTATLLADGRVLVAGGEGTLSPYVYSPIASAEIYDPSTGAWSTTTSMAGTHARHTATLLDNGQVFIVGGCIYSDSCGGSSRPYGFELYDPAAGTWSRPAYAAAPDDHAAAKLNDGKVFVAGLINGARYNYIYDPNTDSFVSAGTNNARRHFPTATVLNNGQVLLAGGHGTSLSSPYASAELYIPEPASPPVALHVGDLDGISYVDGQGGWGAIVTITILDNNGIPVYNAGVRGKWSSDKSGSTTVCYTNSSGKCDVYSGSTNKGSLSFTVTNVSHTTLTYDATANRDPDGDSNGTTITVSKP